MKRPVKRKRGGASHPCPRCGGDTEVVVTKRMKNAVQRLRQCKACGHRYYTYEKDE